MDVAALEKIEGNDQEDATLDFKASFDPSAPHDWCELIKDVVAMANSGGGIIVFGINDDGTPSGADLSMVLGLDPAMIVDKVAKYTDQHFASFALSRSVRQGTPVAILSVSAVTMPIVFTLPGTYDVGVLSAWR
jgi:hypothetical protein